MGGALTTDIYETYFKAIMFRCIYVYVCVSVCVCDYMLEPRIDNISTEFSCDFACKPRVNN